ncbi:protease [Trametes punicea]|nr:protease [Trametes punicea]
MFCTSTLAMSLLALLAAANCIPQGHAINIQLWKRNTLTRADNTFNHDQAIRQNVKVINKYRRNLINIQRNTGRLPENVSVIPPLATLPITLLERRQIVPLVDLENDSEWAGNITVGTPPARFFIDFDTGSADLWIPASSCETCGSQDKYNPSASSTSTKENGTFQIEYGDGSSASGPVYTDTVAVGGIKAMKQYFSAVSTESSEFVHDPTDGILGLAFPAISNLGQNPFFVNAFAQNQVVENVFAFKLSSTSSELYIGGTNQSLFNGSIEYHNLSSSEGFWQIGNARALVNGQAAVSGFQTIIDSGTTIMYGPPAAVKDVYAAVEGSQVFDEENGFYSYPCISPPTVAFSWGGKSWQISTANFDLGETELGSGQCVGALAGQDLGLGSNVWLLGDSFMKNVYTAFSFERNAVGFAALN